MKRTYFFVVKGFGSLLDISGKNTTADNYNYKSPLSDRIALNYYGLKAKKQLTRSCSHD